MVMEPAPRDPEIDTYTIFCALLFAIILYIMNACDSKQLNNIKKSCAKAILDKAHKEAVASVDTLDFCKCRIDLDAARKDSALATKEIQKLVQQMYDDKRYESYKIDSASIRIISPNETIYGLISYFDSQKAMQSPEFAKNYELYQRAIQRLEIARRRQKQK